MKRSIILSLFAIIIVAPLFGCAEYYVKKTIDDWENAINNNDENALEDLLSPDSDFWIISTTAYLLDHFSGFTPVKYSNLDISIENPNADVFADATYNGVPVEGGVWFVLKKEEALLSFIFPDWKIYRYYDFGDWSNPVWRKLPPKK